MRYISIFFILLTCLALGVFVNLFNNRLIDFSILENYNPGKPSVLLDDQGVEWARFELDKREPVNYEHFPKYLVDAFIASEDRDFFEHSGISFKAIVRSIIVNLKNGGKLVQGASTITQQLVKLLFFDSKKTFSRKLKEQFFSLLVERQFSKEQILQIYLNHVYFGCGIYGVEAASQRFFGKSVKEITIGEAANLAAVIRSPATYCPLLNPKASKKRRDLILGLMKKLNFISLQEYNDAKSTDINLINFENSSVAPHLKETIRIFLEEKLGKEKLYFGALKIQTTLNLQIQQIAQKEFTNQFAKLKEEISTAVDGGLITIEANSGEIKALIGGYNFSASKSFNRALQAKRQMGSIFKPIVYASGVISGMSFSDTEIDEPLEINLHGNVWKPRNNTRDFEGEMTLARALSYSKNVIAVKTLLKAGCSNVVNLAKKFRLSSKIEPYPSLALGCIDGTLKEAAGLFNVFANNGTYIEPHFIRWIKNELGTKIFKVEVDKEEVLGPIVNGQVVKVLSVGIQRYLKTFSGNSILFDAIGKTGTTNDSRTCWFCGSTPEFTTAVYIGCDNNKSMGKTVYPVRTVFPIWLALHKQISLNEKEFSYDPALKEIYIDWFTGKQSDDLHNSNVISIMVP